MKYYAIIALCTLLTICNRAKATDYYTATSDAELRGNTIASNYLTTNPDGLTGLGSYVVAPTDNIYMIDGSMQVIENTVINNLIVTGAFVVISSAYDKTLIVSGTLQLGGVLRLNPPMAKTITLQLGNGETGQGNIVGYNGAVINGNTISLDVSFPRAGIIIKGGAAAAAYIIPKNAIKNNSINNLEINLANIGSYVIAAYNSSDNYLKITGELKLTKGRFNSQAATSNFLASLTLSETATVSGGYANSSSDYSYIQGFATILTNTTNTRMIPTGGGNNLDNYRPVYLIPQNTNAGEYTVAYYEDGAEESSICNTARLTRYSIKDFWNVSKTTTSPPVKVGITYNNKVGNSYWRFGIAPATIDLILLAHKPGSCWQDENGNRLSYNATTGILYTSGYLSTLSPFTAAYGPASVLPLQLKSFGGQTQVGYNILQWKTANEVNTKTFFLERSIDGLAFNNITTIAAKLQAENFYEYKDFTFTGHTNFYRLKIIDADGRYTISSIIKITTSHNKQIQVFPNPAYQTIQVSGMVGELKFYNSSAQQLMTVNTLTENTIIPISQLKSGLYFITSGAEPDKKTASFIKKPNP